MNEVLSPSLKPRIFGGNLAVAPSLDQGVTGGGDQDSTKQDGSGGGDGGQLAVPRSFLSFPPFFKRCLPLQLG